MSTQSPQEQHKIMQELWCQVYAATIRSDHGENPRAEANQAVHDYCAEWGQRSPVSFNQKPRK